MTIIEKPFINVDEQVQKLIKRGLTIDSIDEAKNFLLKTTYYDVINGYKETFLEPKSREGEEDVFIPNTKFDDLLKLYELDNKMRQIALMVLLDIECNFYSALSYCISEKYGEKQADYLKKENYKEGKIQSFNRKSERENLLRKINKKIATADEQPLKYYKDKYSNVPPWILVKALTFGELLVLYKLSSAEIKSNVIKILIGNEPNEADKEFFLKSMELFNKFRNRAAHGGRMYNFNTNIQLPFRDSQYSVFGITKENYNKGVGKSDFAAFIIALINLHQNDSDKILKFIVEFHYEIEKYSKKQPIQSRRILELSGLPFDYYDRFISWYSVKRT